MITFLLLFCKFSEGLTRTVLSTELLKTVHDNDNGKKRLGSNAVKLKNCKKFWKALPRMEHFLCCHE